MPWTAEDVKGWTKKADTPKKRKTGAEIANKELARCKKAGEGDCEGRAIRVAKAAIAKMGEAFGEWLDEQDDDTQGLVEDHIHGLKTALRSERKLRRDAVTQLREGKEFTVTGDFVPLIEKSVRKDGTIPIKIVAPGWGNSGYYSSEVLERDAKAFEAGTKMFWDHPTEDEEAARPEGSLRNLAGELASDAHWDEGNVMGPGLYTDAHVFTTFQGAVDELAPHIGISLRGMGKAKDGEVGGKSGPIVQEIAAVQSVDFVTMPGAGGKVLQLFESARDAAGITTTRSKKMEELQALKEANDQLTAELTEAKEATEKAETAKTDAVAEVAKLKEGVLLREARDFVSGKLAGLELPDVTRDRLIESLSKNPPIKDGAIDEDTYVKSIDETVKAEAEYLAKVAGSGVIKGMGGSGETGADEGGREALKESFKAKFLAEGMSAEEADAMAESAAAGR